jgi:hypothetical protein
LYFTFETTSGLKDAEIAKVIINKRLFRPEKPGLLEILGMFTETQFPGANSELEVVS